MVRPQATGAQPHTLHPAIYLKAGLVNVGEPARIGAPLGVAYVVAKLAVFTADLAFRHANFLFDEAVGFQYNPLTRLP